MFSLGILDELTYEILELKVKPEIGAVPDKTGLRPVEEQVSEIDKGALKIIYKHPDYYFYNEWGKY